MAIQDQTDQRLDTPAEARRYARVSRRLLAMVVDMLVYALVTVLVIVVEDALPERWLKAVLLGWVAFVLFYEPVLVSRRGATIGHGFANIRVVDMRSGCPPGFLRAFARFWLKGLVGLLAFAFMGTTRRHQALHDLALGTTVEIRDPSKAHPAHYAAERLPEPAEALPRASRRVTIIVLYSLATLLVTGIGHLLLESEECLDRGRCSSGERVLDAVITLLDLGALAAWIVLGWSGKLPGARARSGARPDPPASTGVPAVGPVDGTDDRSRDGVGRATQPAGTGQRGRRALRVLRTAAVWAGGLALLAVLGVQAAGVVWLAQQLDELPSLRSAATVTVDEIVESGALAPERAYDPAADGRRIVLTSAINPATAKPVVERLLLLDSRDPRAPIDLFLSSRGGWGLNAFAIIDTMHSIRAPVNVHAIGHCFSACALILVAGTGTRTVTPRALVMVHANLDESDYMATDRFMYKPAYNDRFERLWREHAALPADWFPMTGDEAYYLTPEQALEFKIVDRVVSRKRE